MLGWIIDTERKFFYNGGTPTARSPYLTRMGQMNWQTTVWSDVINPSTANFYLVVGLLLVIVVLLVYIVLQHFRRSNEKIFDFRTGSRIVGKIPPPTEEDESLDAFDELTAERTWLDASDELFDDRPLPGESLEPIPGEQEYVNDLLFPPLAERQLIWNSLSPRLKEVAARAATGKRNADIARELSISKRTVEAHLAATYHRLGVHSRTQLSVWLRDIVY